MMTDEEIIALVMGLPIDRREALLIQISFESRSTLSITRTMTGLLTRMSRLCGLTTRISMVDMLRDCADNVERPVLAAAE